MSATSIDSMSYSILNGVTYVSGHFGPDYSRAVVLADDINVFSVLKCRVVKTPKMSKVVLGNKEYDGVLVGQQEENVTVELNDGTLVKTKFDKIITQPYPSFSFYTRGQEFDLLLKYFGGLTYSVESRVISRADEIKLDPGSVITIEQEIVIANNMPYDLTNIMRVQIHFQNARNGDSQMRRGVRKMAHMSHSRPINESVDDQPNALRVKGTTVTLTHEIDNMGKNSSTKFDVGDVELKVVEAYTKISLDNMIANSLEMDRVVKFVANNGKTVYPSNVFVRNELGLPSSNFRVPMVVGEVPFDATIFPERKIKVEKLEVTKKLYELTLYSFYKEEIKVKIVGYRLRGRVDTFILQPGIAQVVSGEIQEDKN